MQFEKMDPHHKADWVLALRSGEYQQGIGFLRTINDRFCCLGVKADQMAKAGLIDGPAPSGWAYTYGDLAGGLDHETRCLIGLGRAEESTLISMNDGGKSFLEIADWIEGNL